MEIVCAYCHKPFVKATRRQGLPDRLLSLVYVYPFRCQVCGHRFHLLQWGLRYIERDVDRRQYERRPVTLRLDMSTGKGQYEGHTVDLAMGGCAINAYDPQIHEGALLNLRLKAFDNEPPIVVDAAVVRVANGTRLGVEFLRIANEEKERLSRYILSLWMDGTQVARRGRKDELIGAR
jgi:c-di-GMP-binding flagellar brake protein YcgR